MSSQNLYVDHLAWCGLVALRMARRDGVLSSPAQENLARDCGKKRLFRKELASDIKWLLTEGREKGLRADLPGKLEYLWRASRGDLLEQNDLFRLQHVIHAIKLTGINYGVLTETEWKGKHAVKISETVPGIYFRKSDLDSAFNSEGKQIKALAVRITANLSAVDGLLTRAGWIRESGEDPSTNHCLLANVEPYMSDAEKQITTK
ncbi:DUF2913 family protein [Candidatus Pantoea bituminis]|uniref:DUF2913 family protein n=1 Tax=Candidatus Pantoea bituminis TaxID=2831036 RepID=UPI001C061187|nr:DUF2913 family protein [Pantoea bituminis]